MAVAAFTVRFANPGYALKLDEVPGAAGVKARHVDVKVVEMGIM
jgi:hypothetical protein